MSNIDSNFVAGIHTNEALAEALGMSADELQGRLDEVAGSTEIKPEPTFEIGEFQTENNCTTIPIKIGLLNVIELGGHLKVCLGECWEAELSMYASLFGNEITRRTVRLDCNGGEVIVFDLGLGRAARVTLYFGARSSQVCFYLRGEAQFLHWIERFDETLFCVAAPASLDAA